MPLRNPKINVVIDKFLFIAVKQLAAMDNVSISTKIRDLIKMAVDLEEDIALEAFALQREGTIGTEKLRHDEIWQTFKGT